MVEVKAHRNTGDPRINPEATPEKFAKERLSQAETGKLWGRDVDDVTRKAAERFLRDIKNKMPLRGLIVDIQHVLGVKTKTRWFEWKKGVGNETSNP